MPLSYEIHTDAGLIFATAFGALRAADLRALRDGVATRRGGCAARGLFCDLRGVQRLLVSDEEARQLGATLRAMRPMRVALLLEPALRFAVARVQREGGLTELRGLRVFTDRVPALAWACFGSVEGERQASLAGER